MLFLLSVFLATKSKASIILDCEDGWWNLTVQYTASQQIFVPRVGDVTFTLDVLDDGAEVLHWSSDFNEGQINLFSGGALIKTDHLSATNKNAKFNCEITFEGEGLPPLFDKRRNQYLATIGHGDSGDPDILSKNNTEAVLSKWFLKSFNGPDLRGEQILQKADVLGSWGNKTNPYFFVVCFSGDKVESFNHFRL